jgi:IS4 transposase
LTAFVFVVDEDLLVYSVVVDNQVYNHLEFFPNKIVSLPFFITFFYLYYAYNLNRMDTVQDKHMQDVQGHHMYNKLFLDVVVEDKMFGIVVVVVDEIHFVVEIVLLNQIDNIVYDDVGIVVDDDAVIDVAVAVDDEMMIVVVEMDDDFVHFVLVVYSYHLIVLLNDH